MQPNSIVRAVDLGFGNVKYVTAHPPGGGIACGMFPPLAPIASSVKITGGLLEQPDTIVVEVDGTCYEVGPGVPQDDSHGGRILHSDYVRTPEYLAIMRGVLHYLHLPVVDLLVVGLPVQHATTRASELQQRLLGKHPTVVGECVDVRQVLCLAQPVGGFMHHALSSGSYGLLQKQVNLVIDVGFFTLDWLLCEGFRPVPRRCGHTEGGVSAILRPVAERIGREFDTNYSDWTRLDRAVRTGYLSLFGKSVPIAPYLHDALPVMDKAIAALMNSIGSARDIETVVMVGGGASLYHKAVQARFPRHPVVIVPDSVCANVRGFQLAGERVMEKRRQTEEVA